MSLEVLRRDAIQSKRDLTLSSRRRARNASRALSAITNLISKNAGLATLVTAHFDSENSPPPDSEESRWLNSYDISSGQYFDDASIPYPTISQDDDPTSASKPTRHSSQPSEPAQESTGADAPSSEASIATPVDPASSIEPMTDDIDQYATTTLPESEGDVSVPATYSQKASQEPDGPIALPAQVAPPLPEDQVHFSNETQQLVDSETPQRPAKVVQLPPEDVQEERMREVEEERSRRSEDGEQIRVSRTHQPTHTDPASSPSSTVGAYSAATPLPPQDSPDTSPDSENGENEVLPPQDMRPSPEEQREKEEHDRLLEAQKDLARRQALGDVSTADDQLKWEEREAAARDAEERAAREDVNGPEPDAKEANEETQAEEVVEGVERDKKEDRAASPEHNQDTEVVAEPSLVEEPSEDTAAQEDGDNITVAPRNKLPLSIDTSGAQHQPVDSTTQPTPGEQERMTTRTSSGVLQKRSVSEILGQTPSRRDFYSPDGISPVVTRQLHESPVAGPSTAPHQPSRRPPRPSTRPRTPTNSQSLLDELAALKGASEDPNRDYLEPLFRIQAHDSPNIRTTALPDLVRTSTKTLSTEDQFTTLHERLDYRILRRIYQLQNANKWSLRQMEKAREPEQPVSHHDHMMAEMQWMRKDFKAERKMKKSVCAWLARRCAEWVAASPEERQALQVQIQPPKEKTAQEDDDAMPDLEHAGESPVDEVGPSTPQNESTIPSNLIIPPELSETVFDLEKNGKLSKTLESLPIYGPPEIAQRATQRSALTPVSKFVGGKVLPRSRGTGRKRSRYEYEDEAEFLDSEPENKRLCNERDLEPEDQEIALFHPENKHIRDRLHANNAFRPPSEFVMPSTQFYEFRNGSQWVWEDDQKLKRLAKEYSFNWSLIADELQLPWQFKSSAERRTPWECFERWVELEQLPTEMKKTLYFKTWFQRLEQSQQAADRRYQVQVAALQAAHNGQVAQVPIRKKTIPSRVEKRKNSRYLWLVDAMRKGARKKEQQAYKAAEVQRAASQRKSQSNENQQRAPMLTPQEFSKKRHERDLQIQEAQRQHKQKMLEAHQRQIMAARQQAAQQQQQQQQAQQAQQQGMQNGNATQQRPGSSTGMPAQQAQMQPNAQQQANINAQMAQQARRNMSMATQNGGHLAVPQVNAQGIPQAQMRPNSQMSNPQDMQRMAQANAQAQARSQYGGQQQQQQYQMPSANMMSPGNGGMSAQQLNQSNQAMMASIQQQMNSAAQQNNQSASPSMPPPPAPQNIPQTLSSGHVPALLGIKSKLSNQFPRATEEQINQMATEMLKNQSQTTNQQRQSAMNAAAGISSGVASQSNLQAYGHNQAMFQNQQMPNGNNYMNGDASGQQANMSPASPQQYAAIMRQRQMAQMRSMGQSPNATHANLNSSPSLTNASPSMAPVSPNMQYANMNQMPSMNMGGMNPQQRPPSRSNTPQVQRIGSSGNMAGGVPSPQGVNGMQGSPRNMQANMAR